MTPGGSEFDTASPTIRKPRLMVSPFRKHQQHVRGLQSGIASRPDTAAPRPPDAKTQSGQEYAALNVALEAQLRKMQDIESVEKRNPLKTEASQLFAPWIAGVIAADEPVQDDIVTTNMIWAVDTGNFDYALQLGRFVLKHGLAMPERYNRSAACFLREDIAEIAIRDPDAVSHEVLMDIDALTIDADMADQAKAKLDKALGRSWMAKAESFDPSADNAAAGGAAAFWQQAQHHLERALKLDENVGAKTDLKTVEKHMKALAEKSDA